MRELGPPSRARCLHRGLVLVSGKSGLGRNHRRGGWEYVPGGERSNCTTSRGCGTSSISGRFKRGVRRRSGCPSSRGAPRLDSHKYVAIRTDNLTSNPVICRPRYKASPQITLLLKLKHLLDLPHKIVIGGVSTIVDILLVSVAYRPSLRSSHPSGLCARFSAHCDRWRGDV